MSSLPAYRPVVLIGRGYRFAKMDHLWNVPMLTTWRAADVIADDHPLFFGRPGSLAPKYANLIVQTATHLEVVGARLDLPQVGYQPENFAPNAVRCEIDDTPCDEWIEQCRRWKNDYPIIRPEYYESEYVNQYVFIDTLSGAMGPDDVLVVGSSGQASDITYPAFKVKKGQRILSSPGLGAMGFGLPAAIGASLASGRRVICIEGDGSLQLNMQELETMRRLNLNIKLFVLNNGGYATIRNTSKRHFEGRDHTAGMRLADTGRMLIAYGLTSWSLSKLKPSDNFTAFLNLDGPQVCEVLCDPNLELSPRLRSKMVDGKIIPGRLEDVE
jgi:acetolactate synthase-1/2/3 large subunit